MLKVKRINKKFNPDYSRVIIKPHIPHEKERIERIIMRVLGLAEEKVHEILNRVCVNFSCRHKDVYKKLEKNYQKIKKFIPAGLEISEEKKKLLGAYFSCEYSIQAAAFFNPSIVLHPDQSGLEDGSIRFLLSFRSVGEGHISSVEFRSGILNKHLDFSFDEVSSYSEKATLVNNSVYDKHLFFSKIPDIKENEKEIYGQIFDLLPQEFCVSELNSVLSMIVPLEKSSILDKVTHLAECNYELHFDSELDISEKVIFPASKLDSNGIEDARFVRFTEDDGSITYYATYTAYDGHNISPQIIETKDFNTFKIITLVGNFSKNKGMALFPRKINGKYMMISRVDGESLYLMSSDNLHVWEKAEHLKAPENDWEFIQIGNCGSPIETEHGWILLTHGVGPMREYSIGVILLDIENPVKIIGNIIEPLLTCNQEERNGYVPNVVYSCGAILHKENLIIPYAMSDTCSGIAMISLCELLDNIHKQNGANIYVNCGESQK